MKYPGASQDHKSLSVEVKARVARLLNHVAPVIVLSDALLSFISTVMTVNSIIVFISSPVTVPLVLRRWPELRVPARTSVVPVVDAGATVTSSLG